MSQKDSSDEEWNEKIIKENNRISIDNILNSEPFKLAIQSTILSMKNLFQSGKSSLTNKINITHKSKHISNNSSFDEINIEEKKDGVETDITESKKNIIDDGHKNKETEKKAHLNNKNSENIKPNDLDKYCLFFYEDEEKNKKFYSFHSDHENK